MAEWIRTADKMPPDMETVIVTIIGSDGKRYVWTDVRFNRKMEGYCEEFVSEHPSGVWEWAYEAGADYWEDVSGTVIAWMSEPEPYMGD